MWKKNIAQALQLRISYFIKLIKEFLSESCREWSQGSQAHDELISKKEPKRKASKSLIKQKCLFFDSRRQTEKMFFRKQIFSFRVVFSFDLSDDDWEKFDDYLESSGAFVVDKTLGLSDDEDEYPFHSFSRFFFALRNFFFLQT